MTEQAAITQSFDGRVVLVTGAASGIGYTVARYFADRGARVVGVDLDARVLDLMAELPGAGHHGIASDLTVEGAPRAVVDETVRLAGGVDILVNSAGIALLDAAVDVPFDRWQATLDVNVSASFFLAQAAGRVMIGARYGRIVNLASQAALIGLDQHAAYAASKGAIVALTRVLSLEWARHGVTVNAISPTVVETPLGKKAWAGEKGERAKEAIPVGRFAQPEEIAALIGYLAGEDAAMVTGSNVVIDGGFTSV